VPVLTSDDVRDVLTLAGYGHSPGTATLLHALEASDDEAAPVAAVVRCLARAGADGHTVLPAELLTEMLVGQGAGPEQAVAAITGAVDLGHVLTFGEEQPDEADAPRAEVLLSLAEIGMAEEAVAESLLSLLAAAEVVLVDVPHGGSVPDGPGVVDLRDADVVGAASLLERVADADRVVLVGDSGLPAPAGPGQLVADLLAVAPEIGLRVDAGSPDGGNAGPVITALCAAVRAGTLSPVEDPTREVVVVPAADGAEAAHRAAQLVNDSLPRALGLTGDDVAVLTPLRRGPAGADALRAAGLPAFTARAAMGRTWPGVVAVLPPEACGVLSRPLVYAMFSRAERHLSVVHAAGPVLARAVRETGARPRRTRLSALLRAGL
jgi:exodeoxyribonuclease V alpha subunit